MPGLPPPLVLAALSLSIFLAGLVQGLTGFGFILVSVPILLLFLDAPTTVVLSQLLALGACIYVAARHWRAIRPLEMLLILAAAAPCIWVGAQALLRWPSAAIKVLAGLVVLAAAAPLLLGVRYRVGRERLGALVAGAISGFLQGSTGMSGPPVVILLANQGWRRDVFRASVSFYLALASLISLAIYAANGALQPDHLAQAAWLLPALALGTFSGTRLAPRVNLKRFQLLVNGLLCGAGLSSAVTGLLALACLQGSC
jgi:uncharacterized membrane protein YfcA